MADISATIMQLLKEIYPFSDLNDQDFNLISPFLEVCEYMPDRQIYAPGENAHFFYFLLTGKIEIYKELKEKQQVIQFLQTYDHFGEDAIARPHYKTGAVAKTHVILARISRENLMKLSTESAMISRIFHMFEHSYRNSLLDNPEWRKPSETTYLQLRRHPLYLWSKLLPTLIFTLAGLSGFLYLAFINNNRFTFWLVLAALALCLGVLIGVWYFLAWKNEYLFITKDRILVQKLLIGVFESRQETPMNAVLSVGQTTSFLGRLIGFGTITARAYTGNLPIQMIPDPDLVYAYLEYRRKSILADQRRREKETMQYMLEHRLFPEDTISSPPAPSASEIPTQVNYYNDSILDLIARFFTLRLEKDGAIIYWTHWFILLKKLFFPSLLLLAVILLILFRLVGLISLDSTFVYSAALIGAVLGWAWWFYEYADWRMDIYIITTDQLVDVNKHPFSTEDKNSAPVKNIQTVEYARKGIIGMALNFGTVKIQIGNQELTFDDVYNPSAVQMEIFNRFREFGDHSRKIEQKRMADWLTVYDHIRNREHPED